MNPGRIQLGKGGNFPLWNRKQICILILNLGVGTGVSWRNFFFFFKEMHSETFKCHRICNLVSSGWLYRQGEEWGVTINAALNWGG